MVLCRLRPKRNQFDFFHAKRQVVYRVYVLKTFVRMFGSMMFSICFSSIFKHLLEKTY